MPVKYGAHTKLEKLILYQKFALRLCTKSRDTSYQELLQLFSLPDLQQRRLYLDLCTMFRIINGLFYFPNDVFVHQTSSIITHGHNTRAGTIQGRVQPSLACTPVMCVCHRNAHDLTPLYSINTRYVQCSKVHEYRPARQAIWVVQIVLVASDRCGCVTMRELIKGFLQLKCALVCGVKGGKKSGNSDLHQNQAIYTSL